MPLQPPDNHQTGLGASDTNIQDASIAIKIPRTGPGDNELDGFSPDEYWFEAETGTFYLKRPCIYCHKNGLRCIIIQSTLANPNPISSCSSCVALYRGCSLSNGTKRQISFFETDQPVIGNLHGVLEQEDGGDMEIDIETPNQSKKKSSKLTSRTKPMRDWLSCHQDHPYPSTAEKELFAQSSGLSSQQIQNWFANARRRLKQSGRSRSSRRSTHRSGSPMPQQTPFDRWRNSPPEEEHVSIDLLQNSLGDLGGISASVGDVYQQDQWSDSSWLDSCSSLDSMLSDHSTFDDESTRRVSDSSSQDLQCTFCESRFARKTDRKRHERSVHTSWDNWVCQIENHASIAWLPSDKQPRCGYCGTLDPDHSHLASHEIESCKERNVSDRSFTRRDHLLQHIRKYHRVINWEGINWPSATKKWRRWHNQQPEINVPP